MTTKVALITGAAQRLGAATSKALHQKGYNIAIHYHHSNVAAEELCRELNNLRARSAITIKSNLCDSTQISTIVSQTINHFSRLDVLVNNASTFYPTPVGEIDIVQINDLFNTNMIAPLLLSQACAPYLKTTNGVIINMCDIHAAKPLAKHTVYCMAKAGLSMMTLSLANELAPDIRVNGIAPGAIIWPTTGISSSDISQVVNDIPLKRQGSITDITQAVCYLIDAEYMTGQIIAIDGGRCISASIGA